jgi:hypothetical protein
MSILLKKLIIIFSIVVFILFISLIVAAWLLGAFAPVHISIAEQGPYYFLTSEEKTTYAEIATQLEIIRKEYGHDNKNNGIPAALILSDLTQVSQEEVIAQAGYILPDSLEVDSQLLIRKIKKRKVLVATIEANPSIAVFKIYPSLLNWLEKNQKLYRINFPALETYQDTFFKLEIPIHTINNN